MKEIHTKNCFFQRTIYLMVFGPPGIHLIMCMKFDPPKIGNLRMEKKTRWMEETFGML